mgnify:FL=1
MPSLTTFKLLKQEHNARRGEFKTVHGTVQTPAFQNVATAGAIKGGLSAQDLQQIGTQVMLCNTYHLHLRPGDQLVADMGGLHKFTRWNGPILTDSGGFQVFSLSKLRKITEEGVTFASHLDGHRIFMGLRRVCRSRQTWAPPSQWPLMSVWRILPSTRTPKPAVSAPPAAQALQG